MNPPVAPSELWRRVGVAAALRDELGATFAALGHDSDDEVVDVEVDRDRQVTAIACHASQATDNAVVAGRLALQGPLERVRFRSARVGATSG